jgi:Leucine Rich repeat
MVMRFAGRIWDEDITVSGVAAGRFKASDRLDSSARWYQDDMIVASPVLKPVDPPRRRIRFSLRSLFVVVSLLCGWMGYLYSSAKRQERAVASIEQAAGHVEYDWWRDADGSPRQQPTPRGPAWLRSLLGPHYFDTVVGVDISHTSVQGSPSQFATFKTPLLQLPKLRRLHIFRLELSDADYAAISQLQGLEELSLAKMELSAAGAAQIASLANLRELNLSDDIVPAAALLQIKEMPKLQSLYVYCRHEDRAPNGFPIWNLEKYAIRDDALRSLPTLTNLKTLSLTFTQITDDGVSIVGRMPKLESFWISSPRITNASMDHLTKLQRLRSLGVSVCGMDGDGVARLAELPNLTNLRISGPAIGNDCLPIIARLQRLESLDLGGKNIDDAGMKHLEGMKNLRHLDLQSTEVKTDGPAVVRLKQALPQLRIRQYYPSPSFR